MKLSGIDNREEASMMFCGEIDNDSAPKSGKRTERELDCRPQNLNISQLNEFWPVLQTEILFDVVSGNVYFQFTAAGRCQIDNASFITPSTLTKPDSGRM